MATYEVLFYVENPAFHFSLGVGNVSTWGGPAEAEGVAVITDTESGIEEFTLDDDSAGAESARADVTVGGRTSNNSRVDAEATWTVRDLETGVEFEIAYFQVEQGPARGNYTLSEMPLVVGRSYEIIAVDTNPNAAAGDPAFDVRDYIAPDGVVDGTSNSELIDATFFDDDGDSVDDEEGSGPDGYGNVIYGGGGNDTILAGLGDDYVEAGNDDDVVYGGLDDDSVLGLGGDDLIYGDDGDFSAAGGDDTLRGGAGNDTIFGEAGADLLDGGADADSLVGGIGADTLEGGEGDDTLDGGADADVIDGGSGDDSILGGSGADLIEGGTGADTIDGGAEADTISGGEGTDSILGGAGNDSLGGGLGSDTVDGGIGDDTISGDQGSRETLDWRLVGDDEDDVSAGVTQNTGDIDVSVSFADPGDNNPSFTLETSSTIYTEPSEDFAPNSSLYLFGSGDNETSDTTISFAAATGAAVTNEVANVAFRISDIDWAAANHRDVVTIVATNAAGEPQTIVITPAGNDTVVGDTITAAEVSEGADDAEGSVLVEIAGPVSEIQILYSNAQTGNQGINVSNISFDTIPNAATSGDSLIGGTGDDLIEGMAGDDTIDGGADDDTITGGTGDDTLTGGDGEDEFILGDGFGADLITDFDIGDDDGDGFFNDQLDVSALTDADGNPVDTGDVVVSDDGFGNAVLTFPNGETLRLQGVAPEEINTGKLLNAAGIPCFTSGTLIDTPKGEVPVETLKVGDLVLTRDNGPQAVRWVGQRHLGRSALEAFPRHRPVFIPEGVLGNHSPLLVSPLHGMMLGHAQIGEEALVRARHLAELPGPVRIANGKRRVSYHHVLFAEHQIIYANGAPSESFYPGPSAIAMYPASEVAQIAIVVPGLGEMPIEACYGPPARPFLRRSEVLHRVDLRRSAQPVMVAAE